MLLDRLFAVAVERQPQALALVAGGQRHCYGEIDRAAGHLAAAMADQGVHRGDRVLLFLSNGYEMVVALYATLRCGAVMVPINPQTKAAKLTYILRDARPACLVSEASLVPVCTESLAQLEEPCRVLLAEEALSGEGPSFRDPHTIDQDLAAILYTSGSTGEPKGVMLTHLNMSSAADSIGTYLGLRSDDVIYCALPLSFDYGLYQIFLAFRCGAAVVLERSFTYPARALQTMAAEGVTVFPGVPTMFSMLIGTNGASGPELPLLRTITNTAAALPESHIRDIRRRFPAARLFSMYGLTECKRVTYLPPEELDLRPGSVGRGMPNEEVYLVDDAGRRLPFGRTGELVVRGSNVMRGYWNKPEETAMRLRKGAIAGELVLHTGDLFRTDPEGYLYFVARKDDIIKSRGEKVSPREVENVLQALEGVLEAAVVGVPDPLLGEAIRAFLVLKEGYRYTEKEILQHCHRHLEPFMTPKDLVFTESLPKNENGKIDRARLKARLKELSA